MDLSMDNRYVEICGITEKEIHAYLEDEVKELADTQMTTYEETCLKLKQRYDGYHFTAKSEGIYNPFSLLNTFAKMEFGDYWFETGTPSYLVELLKHTHYDLYEMANTETDADVLNSIDSASNNPIPVSYTHLDVYKRQGLYVSNIYFSMRIFYSQSDCFFVYWLISSKILSESSYELYFQIFL